MKTKQISLNNNTSIAINLSWCYPGSFSLATRGVSLFSKVKKETVRVEFSSGFWICDMPVTVKLWNAVLGNHPRNRGWIWQVKIYPYMELYWEWPPRKQGMVFIFIIKLNSCISALLSQIQLQ